MPYTRMAIPPRSIATGEGHDGDKKIKHECTDHSLESEKKGRYINFAVGS